jgi:predicted nucleic acid-binding protein
MPDVVVVDTDVVSYIFKSQPFGCAYDEDLKGNVPLISFMTAAELERWILQNEWGEQRVHRLRSYLRRFGVIHSSSDLCSLWAEVMLESRRAGRRMESADAWIAATALAYDAPLVTNNRKDYLGVSGLKLISRAPA